MTKNTKSNQVVDGACFFDNVVPPDGSNWVEEVLKHVSALPGDDFNTIDFFYEIKQPSSEESHHDILRCHPNFRPQDTGVASPWYDWAIVKYEEDGDTKLVASRVLLWAEAKRTTRGPAVGVHVEDSAHRKEMFCVIHSLSQYDTPEDKFTCFGKIDVLYDERLVVSIDNINSVAYVLPTIENRYHDFPTNERNVKHWLVVPPRSEWGTLEGLWESDDLCSLLAKYEGVTTLV